MYQLAAPPAGAIFLTKDREIGKDIAKELGAVKDALLHKDALAQDGDRVYVDTVELDGLTFHCHSWVDIAQVQTPQGNPAPPLLRWVQPHHAPALVLTGGM